MSDKQYAENLNTGGGSGGASEPSDSFEEVVTGLRDADGNMIYKKSYSGTLSETSNVIDDTITYNTHQYIDAKGRIEVYVDNKHIQVPINSGSNGNFINAVFIQDSGLTIQTEGHQALRQNCPYYLTVYYIHKPVQRASAKKTSK